MNAIGYRWFRESDCRISEIGFLSCGEPFIFSIVGCRKRFCMRVTSCLWVSQCCAILAWTETYFAVQCCRLLAVVTGIVGDNRRDDVCFSIFVCSKSTRFRTFRLDSVCRVQFVFVFHMDAEVQTDRGIEHVSSSQQNLCFVEAVSNQALDFQGGCSPC